MSENVVAVRSIEIVTAEIHTIRDNVARVFMDGVVQIGRRLEEAKQLVPQGEWLQYLDKELGYKPSTAQNYMRIAREFGDGQVGLSGKTPGDFFGNLGYSQLLPLLGLPEEERELEDADKDLSDYQHKLHDEKQKTKAQAEAAKANAETAAELQRRLDAAEQQANTPRELTEEERAALREEIAAEQAEAVQAAEARAAEALARLEKVKNPAAHKVNFLFGELGEYWNRLQAALHELEQSDSEAAGKMREAIGQAVAGWAL